MTNKNKANKAFTLLELLIVVAIIGLLIAIATPAFQGILNRARDTTIKGSLDGLVAAMIMHKMDHRNLTNFCASLFVAEVKSTIQETGIDAKYITCIETADFVIMSSALHTGGGWVVDSTGHTGMEASRIGLVGEWKFEGNANDTSGITPSNHGTIHGATFVDGALSFDGVDDYVNVGNDPSLQTLAGTTFTYEAWVKGLPGQAPHQMFINRFLPYFRVVGNRLHLSLAAGGAQRSVHGTTVLTPNTWYHAVATFDGAGYMRVYLNGVLDGTTGPFLPISNAGDSMRFGRHGATAFLNYRGFLDEVRIFNRALSAAEIKAQFEAGR